LNVEIKIGACRASMPVGGRIMRFRDYSEWSVTIGIVDSQDRRSRRHALPALQCRHRHESGESKGLSGVGSRLYERDPAQQTRRYRRQAGLLNQLKFLEDYCAGNASMDFGDAVEALYKRLRQEGKT
jgi:hypothetical protein